VFTIDPAWQGDVTFYELVYGTWLIYIFLVVLWEQGLRARLPEWKYLLIVFLGASAFWINHYFQRAPGYLILLNVYSVAFLVTYYSVCVAPMARGVLWKLGATLTAVLFTVVFIGFEWIARVGVQRGVNEFWFMATAWFGFLFLIYWRGALRSRRETA
jgi:hypothetical protein